MLTARIEWNILLVVLSEGSKMCRPFVGRLTVEEGFCWLLLVHACNARTNMNAERPRKEKKALEK